MDKRGPRGLIYERLYEKAKASSPPRAIRSRGHVKGGKTRSEGVTKEGPPAVGFPFRYEGVGP